MIKVNWVQGWFANKWVCIEHLDSYKDLQSSSYNSIFYRPVSSSPTNSSTPCAHVAPMLVFSVRTECKSLHYIYITKVGKNKAFSRTCRGVFSQFIM